MKRRILIALAMILALLVGAFFWFTREHALLTVEAVAGTSPTITDPRNELVPTINVAKAIGWKAGQAPTPAAGLKVTAFAAGLSHPRWMLVLANGDVLVAESNSPPRDVRGIEGWVMTRLTNRAGAGEPSPNRITLLRDTDGDGVAEVRSVLLTGLHSPSGMALVGPYLYVANSDALVRYRFVPGQTKIDAPAEIVFRMPGGGIHWARNVVANADGTKLYVSIGSSTNIAEKGLDAEQDRAQIWEYDVATKQHRVFAYGLRNPNGMAWNPWTRELWAVVNERDMLGADLTPDYLTHVELGGFYGWPWYYWSGYIDSRVPEPDSDTREYMVKPDYALGPHVSALGLSFSVGQALAPRFASGAFVGEHGSWNRKPKSGYKVVFVPFVNGQPKGLPVDVLTGFLTADQSEAHGRPVDVRLDGKGALLVADDAGNHIWRVTAR